MPLFKVEIFAWAWMYPLFYCNQTFKLSREGLHEREEESAGGWTDASLCQIVFSLSVALTLVICPPAVRDEYIL
jgi:hypothetical protein